MFSTVDLTYTDAQKSGVTIIGLAALTSLTAIVGLLIFKRPRRSYFQNAHTYGYAMSLLFANIIQAIGSVLDFEWVMQGKVDSGSICSLQGGLKLAGNMGVSLWSLIIALQLFHILFLRFHASRVIFMGLMIAPWVFIVAVAVIGRFVVQNSAHGPFFGIEGASCGISAGYASARLMFDYLLSFSTMGLGLILYIAILLRVRGTLLRDKYHHWTLNVGGKPLNGWNLPVVENTELNSLVRKLVWYPVVFTVLLILVAVVRISESNGSTIPFWLVVMAGSIFNMMGFFNVIVLLLLGNCPSQNILPTSFTEITPRGQMRPSIDKSGDSFVEILVPDGNGPQAASAMSEKSSEKSFYRHSHRSSRKVLVKMPTKPANTFVAPDSWGSMASNRSGSY